MMKSRNLRILMAVVFAASALMVISPEAIAWEKGHIKANPFLKFEEQYDSNIFYDPDDPKHDFISILTPGITSEIGVGDGGKQKVRANYKVDCGMFGKYKDQNYANQDLLGEVELNFADKYKWTTGDNFLFTSDRAGTEFEHRTLRKENTLKSLFEADFNKLSWDAGYSLYNVDYLSDTLKQINRYENIFWTTGYIQIQPKTKALFELQYKNIQYPDASGRNANGYRAMTGLKGQLTAKLAGIAKVGFKIQDYNTKSQPDFYNFVAEIGLDYAYNDRINFLMSYVREPFESTYTNNNYYTGDHLLGVMNYKFGNGFFTKIDGMLFNNMYPEAGTGESKKRNDLEWAAGAKLGYQWKEWFVTDVGYRFHQRASNLHSRDYDQHVVSISAKVMY
ncbi:MAG: outer membrane beta-barrel protein [Candidatus Omnitrophica bacterium]|nr:outer membrane beta-barrel protein [Candidatus Omnitrophota bacterium]